jgi:CHAT domain-containing protein
MAAQSGLSEALGKRLSEFPELQLFAVVRHHDCVAMYLGERILQGGAGMDTVLLLLLTYRRRQKTDAVRDLLLRAHQGIGRSNPGALLLLGIAGGVMDDGQLAALGPLDGKNRAVVDFYVAEDALLRGDIDRARSLFAQTAASGAPTVEVELARHELDYVRRGARPAYLTDPNPYDLQNRAVQLAQAGSLREAIETAEVALEQFLAYCGEGHHDVAAARLILSQAQAATGLYSAAWTNLNLAAPHFEDVEPRTEAAFLAARASLEMTTRTGDPVASARAALTALERATDHEPDDLGAAWNTLAKAYGHAGDAQREMEALERGLAHRREVTGPSSPHTAKSYFSLSEAHRRAGRLDMAKRASEDALAIRRQHDGEDNLTASLVQLAELHVLLKEYEPARALAEETLGLRAGGVAPVRRRCLEVLASCAAATEAPRSALDAALQASRAEDTELVELLRTSSSLTANVHATTHHSALERVLALHAASRSDETSERTVLERVIARKVLLRRFRAATARKLRSAGAEGRAAAREYATANLAQWRTSLPFEYQPAVGTATLPELINAADTHRISAYLLALSEHAALATSRIRGKSDATERLESMERTGALSLSAEEAAELLRDQDAAIPWLQAKLAPGMLVAEVAAWTCDGKARFTVFWITRDRVSHFVIEDGDALSVHCETLLALLPKHTDRKRQLQAEEAEAAIVQTLWLPLWEACPSATHIVLCGVGVLSLLPLDALRVDDAAFVLDRCMVSNAADSRSIFASEERPAAASSSVIFAMPQFDSPSVAVSDTEPLFRPLLHTEREAREIASITNGRLFLGTEASRDHLLDQYRPLVLHLATHGYYEQYAARPGMVPPEQRETGAGPIRQVQARHVTDLFSEILDSRLRSGIALTGCNEWLRTGKLFEGGTGLVTALEFGVLDLAGTRLAVVSSCESGIGDVLPHGAAGGLRSTLTACGAAATITALWTVPDDGSASLMIELYRNLAAGKTRVRALHEAKVALRAQGADRRAWGPFILDGEFGTML